MSKIMKSLTGREEHLFSGICWILGLLIALLRFSLQVVLCFRGPTKNGMICLWYDQNYKIKAEPLLLCCCCFFFFIGFQFVDCINCISLIQLSRGQRVFLIRKKFESLFTVMTLVTQWSLCCKPSWGSVLGTLSFCFYQSQQVAIT